MSLKTKEELNNWVMVSPCLWLFLDYDGTLAEFAPTPEHIEPNQEIIGVLEQRVRRPCTRLTILSGRRLEHVRQLLPVPGLFLAGTYGLEFMDPAGEAVCQVEYKDIRPALETIKPQWQELIEDRNGFFLEDKGWTLALHARFADDQEAEQILTQARQIIRRAASLSHFRILGGHKFLEIAPRHASKRDTVAYLLSRYPLPEARLLYIGDDDKDEEAFPIIHAHQGLAVKVLQPSQAASATTADFCFESTSETLGWLKSLA